MLVYALTCAFTSSSPMVLYKANRYLLGELIHCVDFKQKSYITWSNTWSWNIHTFHLYIFYSSHWVIYFVSTYIEDFIWN